MGNMYVDRLTRVVPPRSGDQNSPATPNRRALACTNATAAIEIDTDLALMAPFVPPSGGQVVPGGAGRVRMQFQADGDNIWICFGSTNAVVANSAVNSGANLSSVAVVPDFIAANTTVTYELDPLVDKWMSARTKNGGTNTATLRYGVISMPTHDRP